MVMNQWFHGCHVASRIENGNSWYGHLTLLFRLHEMEKNTFSVVRKSTLRQLMLHVESIWVATP